MYLERETLSVYLPALRTGFLTKKFYQMPKAATGLYSGSLGASTGLRGRYPKKEQCLEQAQQKRSKKEAMCGIDPANRRIIGKVRLCDKSRTISARANPEVGIPLVCNKYCGNEVFLTRNENTQYLESGREISLRTNFRKTTSQFFGPVAGNPFSYKNCSCIFSKSPERPIQGSKFLGGKTKLLDSTCTFHGVKRGVDVVEKLASFAQWESILRPKKQEKIFSDASKKSWGAHLGPLEIGYY